MKSKFLVIGIFTLLVLLILLTIDFLCADVDLNFNSMFHFCQKIDFGLLSIAVFIIYLIWLITSLSLKIRKNRKGNQLKSTKSKKTLSSIAVVIIALMTLILIACPYLSTKVWLKSNEEVNKIGTKILIVDIDNATIEFEKGEFVVVKSQITGFGMPFSNFQEEISLGDTTKYSLNENGWFAKKICNTDIEFPFNTNQEYEIKLEKGNITFKMPEDTLSSKLSLFVEEGDVELKIPSNAPYIISYSAANVFNELSSPYKFYKNKIFTQSETGLQINIVLANGSLYLNDLD